MLRLSTSKILQAGPHPHSWTTPSKPSVGSALFEKRIHKLNNTIYKKIDSAKDPEFTLNRPGIEIGQKHIKYSQSKIWHKYKRYQKFETDRQKKAMFHVRQQRGSSQKEIIKSGIIKRAVRNMVEEIFPDLDVTVTRVTFVSRTKAAVEVSPPECANELNKQKSQMSMLLIDYMEENFQPLPRLTFTSLRNTHEDLVKKLETLEIEVQKDMELAKQREINEKRERNRLAEFNLLAEPETDQGVDFFGIPHDKSSEIEMSLQDKLEKDVIRTWRRSQKSPLFPLTGIDHSKLNWRIMSKYRRQKHKAAFIDDNSVRSACYRFETHPFQKILGVGKNKKFKGNLDKKIGNAEIIEEEKHFLDAEQQEVSGQKLNKKIDLFKGESGEGWTKKEAAEYNRSTGRITHLEEERVPFHKRKKPAGEEPLVISSENIKEYEEAVIVSGKSNIWKLDNS